MMVTTLPGTDDWRQPHSLIKWTESTKTTCSRRTRSESPLPSPEVFCAGHARIASSVLVPLQTFNIGIAAGVGKFGAERHQAISSTDPWRARIAGLTLKGGYGSVLKERYMDFLASGTPRRACAEVK